MLGRKYAEKWDAVIAKHRRGSAPAEPIDAQPLVAAEPKLKVLMEIKDRYPYQLDMARALFLETNLGRATAATASQIMRPNARLSLEILRILKRFYSLYPHLRPARPRHRPPQRYDDDANPWRRMLKLGGLHRRFDEFCESVKRVRGSGDALTRRKALEVLQDQILCLVPDEPGMNKLDLAMEEARSIVKAEPNLFEYFCEHVGDLTELSRSTIANAITRDRKVAALDTDAILRTPPPTSDLPRLLEDLLA